MDRRHGKRLLPSDHASEEKREDFNFPVQPFESQKEEASSSPFLHLINTASSNRSFSIPVPHRRVSTSGLIEMQDPSQQHIHQGKYIYHVHALQFLILYYINNNIVNYIYPIRIYIDLLFFHSLDLKFSPATYIRRSSIKICLFIYVFKIFSLLT